jgi:hypothetical protein
MTPELLLIRWRESVELIQLSDLTGKPKTIETQDRWQTKDGTSVVVRNVARVEDFIPGEINTLRLRYVKDDQNDEHLTNPEAGAHWGVASIRWPGSDATAQTASAEWRDDADESWDGSATGVEMIGAESPLSSNRNSKPVMKILRPEQQRLRESLLILDRVCVLTSEEEDSALEAAHIIAVKNEGVEVPSNAILLRADLHRLFDAGLFSFELSEDGSVITYSEKLSPSYRKELANAKLPNATFKRVKEALRLRAELAK